MGVCQSKPIARVQIATAKTGNAVCLNNLWREDDAISTRKVFGNKEHLRNYVFEVEGLSSLRQRKRYERDQRKTVDAARSFYY